MRKKRFLSCLLVVLLLAVFSVTLVACKERTSQLVTPEAPVAGESAPSVGDLLLVMLKGMGKMDEDFVSMDFESEIKTNVGTVQNPIWDYRKFYLKGNFRPDSGDMEGEVELGLGVIATDANGNELADQSQNVELFLHNGRFYLKVGATALYLEDVDFNWIVEQLRKINGLQNLVDTILGSIPGLGITGTVDELIGIVAMLIFQIDNQMTTYNTETGTGHIALKFNPDQLIATIVTALGDTSIDGVLAGLGMGLMIPDGNGGMKPYSIDDFLATLAFPNIDVYIEADLDNNSVVMETDANGNKGLQLHVYDWQTEYFHMNTGVMYSTTDAIKIIPDNIASYQPFGLLKLQFNTTITVDVNNVDVGKLVNFFAGTQFLPEGSLKLSANAGLTIKLDADIRLKEEPNSANPTQMDDKSIFLLEVYGDNKDVPMVGLYLKDRKIYVNLDDAIKTTSGNIDIRPGNIVIDDVAVSKWLTYAMGIGTDFVSGLLDGLFPKTETETQTFAAVSDIEFKDGYSINDLVLAVGHDDSGKTYISKTFGTILDIVRYTVGFEKFITWDAETGDIRLTITNEFFHQLCSQFGINVNELATMKDFGAITLGIDLQKGSCYFDVNLNKALFDESATEQSTLHARVELDNFRYGFGAREALLEKIDNATKDKKYIGNLKDFIYNAVDDLDIEFEAKLQIDKGIYNASNILGINTGLPSVNIEVGDAFILDLKLNIQIQMDEVTYIEDGKEVTKKIITRAYIGITNVSANPIFPKDNMTIRLYYLDDRYDANGVLNTMLTKSNDSVHGTLYADMSEFNMIQIGIPSFAIGIDLTDLIFTTIDKLAIEFKIPDFTNPNKAESVSQGSGSQTFSLAGDNTRTITADDSSFVYELYTEDAIKVDKLLKLQLTSELVQTIFDLFNINIGFELPEINIDAEINKIDGIKLSIKTFDGVGEDVKNISLDLAVNTFKMGSPNLVINIDSLINDKETNPEKYGVFINISDLGGTSNNGALNDILQGVINRALDDIDIKFNLNIHLDKGTYDISNILGIQTGLPSIPIYSSEGFDLNFDIMIQLQSAIVPKTDILGREIPNEYEQIISRAIITLQNKAANPLTPKGNGAVRIMYFDDRYEGNKNLGLEQYNAVQTGIDGTGNPVYKVNKTHGTLLLNLSTFNILNFVLPDVALDIDLTQMVNDIIGNISLGDVAFSNYNNVDTASSVKSLFAAVADGDNNETEGASFVKVALTTKLIEEVLRMVGVNLEFGLPQIDGGIIVDSQNGISINIASMDGDKNVTASIGMNKLHLGKQLADDEIAPPADFDITKFGSPTALELGTLLNTIIYRALDDVDIAFDLAFEITKGTYDVGKILDIFGLDLGNEPINIDVSEDFTLDLTLEIKIRWNNFIDAESRLNNNSGITQARISLYNKVPNILFSHASTTEPVLDVFYYDDRGPNNNTLPPLDANNGGQFAYGVNGKKTHGSLFVNTDKFEFAKLQIPNMVIDIDLTSIVKGVIDSLSASASQTSSQENAIASYMSNVISQGYSAVADSVELAEETGNYLQVSITMQFISELLKKFGVVFEVPDILDSLNGNFTISQINGIKLYANLNKPNDDGSENSITLNLGIKRISLGQTIEFITPPASFNDYREYYGTKVISDVNSIIYRLLDDTNIQIKLQADVPQGKYNLAPILKMAGIQIDELFVEFTDAFNLDLTLNIQLQMDSVPQYDNNGNVIEGAYDTILSRACIEIISGSTNFLFEEGTIAKVLYYDWRYEANRNNAALGLKRPSYDETTQTVQKSFGTLFADFSGINIANITIPPITMDIDLTNIIQSISSSIGGSINLGGGTSAYSMNNSGIGLVNDLTNGPAAAAPALGNYVKVVVTTGLLNAILEMLDVDLGEITLPNFSVDAAADADKGIAVVINLHTKDSTDDSERTISASLAFPMLHLGVKNVIEIPAGFTSSYYATDFSNLVKTLLRYGEINAKLNISANSSTINVQRLLNNILASNGMALALPINVDLNDFTNELELSLKWNFDYDDARNTNIALELKCDGNMAMSIYMTGGNVYVDMSGLGLPKFSLVNSNLAAKLTYLVGNALDGMLGGLISSGTAGLQGVVATANNLSVEEMNSELFRMARDGEIENEDKPFEIMDYVTLLLKGLSMSDGVLNIDITAEMMRTLLKELSINIAEDITVKASLDLKNGRIDLNLTFDEISVAARLEIRNLGATQDLTLNINESSYVRLDMSSGAIFVNSLIEQLNPDIWIDLISKNQSFSDYFRYTKITMQRAPDAGMYLAYTNGGWANGGSIVLSLLRMDGGGANSNANGVPALYIILDINSNKLIIRGTSDLLPIDIASLHADTMVNIGIDFNIKKMLSDLIGPIITDINAVDTVAIEDVFSGFSIDSLLRGINVKVYGVRNIKINVELNHNVINDLIPNLINNGLNGMVISLNPAKGNSITVSGLSYNNKSGTNFLNNFWDNLIFPVVELAIKDEGLSALMGIIRPVVNGIKDNVLNLVSRLLPMPEFTELNANVYIVNGKLDNIQLIGYDMTQSGNGRDRLELRIFNDMSQEAFFGYMDALDLNNVVRQAPYIHFDTAVDSATNFVNKFEQYAYIPNKNTMYYNTAMTGKPFVVQANQVTWTVTYYDENGFDLNQTTLNNTFTRSDMSAFQVNGKYQPGYYIATAMAVTSSGTYTTDVRVVIEDNTTFIMDPDTKVDSIVIRSGRTLPTSITLTNEKLDKSIYIRNVEGAMNKFEFKDENGNSTAQQTGIHGVTYEAAKIRINLSSGTTIYKTAKVTWDDASLVLVDTDPIEISIFNYRDFFNNYYNAEKMLVLTSDGRRIYQDVESISISAGYDTLFNLDNNGNIASLANLSKWTSDVGFETQLTIRLANAHSEQVPLTRKVIVKPRIVDYVRFDSKNTIIMDSVQSQSDLPRQARVYFKNGDMEVYTIPYDSWDFSNVVNTEASGAAARTMTFGRKGVYDNVAFRFQQDYGNPTGFEMNRVENITIAINEAVINYAKVGPDNGERYCDISYEDFANKKFDGLDLRLISSDGRETDYVDTITYTVAFRKPAEYDDDGNLTSAESYIENNTAGRNQLNNMSAEEQAKYVPITETINNYEIIDRGITIGEYGGRARVTVRLLNLQRHAYDEYPILDNSRVVETYLYFAVAAPIVREN